MLVSRRCTVKATPQPSTNILGTHTPHPPREEGSFVEGAFLRKAHLDQARLNHEERRVRLVNCCSEVHVCMYKTITCMFNLTFVASSLSGGGGA